MQAEQNRDRTRLSTAGAQAKVHTAAEWMHMQDFISAMYARGMSQQDLLRELAWRGFPVTLAQLKRRVQRWNIQKRVSKAEYIHTLCHNGQDISKGSITATGKKISRLGLYRASRRYATELQQSHGQRGGTRSSPGHVPANDLAETSNADESSSARSDTIGKTVAAPSTILQDQKVSLTISLSGSDGEEQDSVEEELREFCQETFPEAKSPAQPDDGILIRLHAMPLLSNGYRNAFYIADHQSQKTACSNMWKQARYLFSKSRPKEVEALQTVVVEWLPRLVRPTSPLLASSIRLLACALDEQAKYIEAEERHLLHLYKTQRIHGARSREALASQNDLATLYMHTGRLRMAYDEATRAYEQQCRLVGARDLDTLYTLMTIGGICLRSRSYARARCILMRVAREFNVQLGRHHVFTFRVEQELARCLFESGSLNSAEHWYANSVNKQVIALGEDNHETLSGVVRLARVLVALKKFEKAQDMLMHVVEVFDVRHGLADPITLRARLLLAAAYEGQGKIATALATQQVVVDANGDQLHKCPWILKGMSESAWRYHRSGGMKAEALRAQQLVIQMSERQDEPPEETAKHRLALQLMQDT